MESSLQNEEVLDGLVGRRLVAWHLGDGGIHFDMDDGKVVIFSGAFVIAVMAAENERLH